MKWESPKPFRFLCKCPLLEVVMNSLSRRYGENSDVLVSTSLHILWIWSLPRKSNLKNEVIGQIVFQFEWGYRHSVFGVECAITLLPGIFKDLRKSVNLALVWIL